MKSFARAMGLSTLAVSVAAGAQALPNVKEGTLYPEVRARLISQGWAPVRQNLDPLDAAAAAFHAQFPEVRQCAGTGRNPCIFIFRNSAGKTMEVLTVGEVGPRFAAFR